MWSSRLSLLVYLGLYKEAESELEEFGELVNPDLYYQHHTHSYPGRRGKVIVTEGLVNCPYYTSLSKPWFTISIRPRFYSRVMSVFV